MIFYQSLPYSYAGNMSCAPQDLMLLSCLSFTGEISLSHSLPMLLHTPCPPDVCPLSTYSCGSLGHQYGSMPFPASTGLQTLSQYASNELIHMTMSQAEADCYKKQCTWYKVSMEALQSEMNISKLLVWNFTTYNFSLKEQELESIKTELNLKNDCLAHLISLLHCHNKGLKILRLCRMLFKNGLKIWKY